MTHTKSLKSLLPALAAATLLMGTAHMAQAQSTSSSMSTPGSSYIGLSGGPADFSRIGSGNGLFSRDDHDTAYSLTMGNYFPNQNLGVELGYTNFGKVARGGGTTKAEGINLSLIGRMPINPMFNLLGKVGTTYGHTEVSANPLSGMATGSESGFDWSVWAPKWSSAPSGRACCSMTSTS